MTSAVEDAGTGPGPNNVADRVNSPPVRHRSSARVPAGCWGHYQAPPRTQKDLGCFAQPSGSPGPDPRKSPLIYLFLAKVLENSSSCVGCGCVCLSPQQKEG